MAFYILSLLPVLVVLGASHLTNADPVQFKDCGSNLGKISSVDVVPCPSFPCPFKRKSNVSVTMEFTANADISASGTKVYGLILGQLVPFPLPDEDACHCALIVFCREFEPRYPSPDLTEA
ncbi:epididymal secretory protein e1 [Plakobranchus ocellatus]|uniref:Epididymal secretory protein e1 n=1 Tax=Plakobranchus ocellatus TaxID=259542 RepID=A0AAV3ZWY8_9GAST|nr:epididymal secretory protein e1 [Plakobranchus ocellatus]